MKKYSITDAGVLTTENGNEVAYFNIGGMKLRMFRNLNQLKTDLTGSGLLDARIAHNVVSVYDHRITSLLPDFIGGSLTGDIAIRKAGEEYVVEEYSGVMQPTHPDYGKYALGDVAKVTTDHIRVDGFLKLRRDPNVELTVRTARETANLMADLAGYFGVAEASNGADSADAPVDTIPDDIAYEASIAPVAKAPASTEDKP